MVTAHTPSSKPTDDHKRRRRTVSRIFNASAQHSSTRRALYNNIVMSNELQVAGGQLRLKLNRRDRKVSKLSPFFSSAYTLIVMQVHTLFYCSSSCALSQQKCSAVHCIACFSMYIQKLDLSWLSLNFNYRARIPLYLFSLASSSSLSLKLHRLVTIQVSSSLSLASSSQQFPNAVVPQQQQQQQKLG